MLNDLPSKPVDITDKIIESESFIKYPNESQGFLNIKSPSYTIDDMYENLSSIWAYKIEKNIFMFKVCLPNEVFTFFKVDFR